MLAVLLTVVVVGLLLYQVSESRIFSLNLARPSIWLETYNQSLLSPWLGGGLHQLDTITVAGFTYDHPHSVYMTTLFHGGALGLVSLLALISLVVVKSFRNTAVQIWQILLVYGLIYMSVDGSRLFTHPEELWLVFWLPVGFILAFTTPMMAFKDVQRR